VKCVAGPAGFMGPGQPLYGHDGRETRRHRGLHQWHGTHMAQAATMLRGMLVRVFRSEGCRLRTNQGAKKEQYEQPSGFAANVNHFEHYTQPGPRPRPNEKRAPWEGPSGKQLLSG